MTNTIQHHYPLTVYKASAGSGKTFTLAVEYISLLVSNPSNYKHILAVTFTNKATKEMKLRILSQLYGIANSLPSSVTYLHKVLEHTGLTPLVVKANAKEALSLLTHHYNFFRVQTIDAFFQGVLRNLAHELDLTANLRVDLNDDEVEAKAVDEMIEMLDSQHEVLDWVRDYIYQNIEEDQTWNVIQSIKDFGKNIFKEFYKAHEQELNDLLASENGCFFPRYTTFLRAQRNTLLKEMIAPAKELLGLFQQNQIATPSLFRRGLYNFILKTSRGDIDNSSVPSGVQKALEGADSWTATKCPVSDKIVIKEMAAHPGLALLQELVQNRDSKLGDYNSCLQTLSHLSELRLLNAIAKTVEISNKKANRFMLSSTQSLLYGIIRDSDTPFVYEKIGVQLRHIMIDEFQDTSQIQWRNFKVLLDNCMAQEGAHNLIVGDVKQSIYRWRQGDWRLLANLANNFGQEQVKEMTLDTNYRSWGRIINFNNAFFTQLVKETMKELSDDHIPQSVHLAYAYDDVKQQNTKENDKGYVEITLLPSKDYKEKVLAKLSDTVRQLLKTGVKQQNIAILVRSKTPVQLIASYFSREFGTSVRIVSEEAFRLDASLAVNVLVLSLRLLAHPEDNLTRAALVKTYNNDILEKETPLPDLLVATVEVAGKNTENNPKIGCLTDTDVRKSLDSHLPEKFVKEASLLRNMPLLDLVDTLFSLFSLEVLKSQSAYVCLFYDKLNDYLRDRPADIDDFLSEWDKTLSQKTIQSDEVDGIRIMTIHKSKGLEFDNVIIPFCDWQLEKCYTLWCEKGNKKAPFDALPITPVNFKREKLLGTVFEEDYREEHFQNTVENLNLLYVAFTRAGKRLFVMGKRLSEKQKKAFTGLTKNRSQGIELCLNRVASTLGEDCFLLGQDKDTEPLQLIYGTSDAEPSSPLRENAENPNPFEAPSDTLEVNIESFRTPIGFRQSNKSEDFIRGEETDSDNSYIKIGTILHQLFAAIHTVEDIDTKIEQLVIDGIITNELMIQQLRQQIANALSNPVVAKWFQPGWKLYNECSILEYNPIDGTTIEQRPDRVMCDEKQTIIVDYKFAKPRPEHKAQVKRYIELLQKIGHQSVSGYLWYILKGEIVAVKL